MDIRTKIGLLADQNVLMGFLRYQYERILYFPLHIKNWRSAQKRKNGYIDNRFEKIKEMKNSHNGERCFIVATGPSLRVEDVESLKNEITFGVNSIAKIGEKTSWRPTYLGIQDQYIYEKLEPVILSNYDNNVFVADELCKNFQIPDRFILFPYSAEYKLYMNGYKKYGTKFSDNIYAITYDGYSITYSMIQIAVYMGFKDIYLLGCDCNYITGEKNHFIESGFVDKRAYLNKARMTAGYEEAKKYADAHHINIINCTRGGMLEVFPRMSLEEVLGV